MGRGPDPATRLARAIADDATTSGCPLTIAVSATTPWFSATFAGSRVCLVATGAPSQALAGWIAALPETELPPGDQLVADIAVVSRKDEGDHVSLAIEALLVEA